MTTIVAREFQDADGRIVESAARLAAEVLSALESHQVVEIDFHDLKGLSSSYFNVLLQQVLPVTTVSGFPQGVHLRFGSAAQQQVFARCFEFAKRAVA
jgi:hypothetical protein